jgi:hypothetical protein
LVLLSVITGRESRVLAVVQLVDRTFDRWRPAFKSSGSLYLGGFTSDEVIRAENLPAFLSAASPCDV